MAQLLTLAILTVFLAASPVAAGCIMSYCKGDTAATSTPSRSYIRDTSRRIVGDLYDPGHGRRIQIRDNDRKIIGYVERSGRITNPERREVGSIDALR